MLSNANCSREDWRWLEPSDGEGRVTSSKAKRIWDGDVVSPASNPKRACTVPPPELLRTLLWDVRRTTRLIISRYLDNVTLTKASVLYALW